MPTMVAGRRLLLRHSAVSALAMVSKVAQGIVALTIITKTMGADAYGVWLQTTVAVGLLMPLASLSLDKALLRFMPEAPTPRDQGVLFATILSVSLAGCALVGVALTLGLPSLFERLSVDATLAGQLGPVLAALLAASAANTLAAEFLRARTEAGSYAALCSVRDLGWAAVVTIAARMQGDIVATLWASALWLALVAVGGIALVWRRVGRFGFSPGKLGVLLRYSTPILVAHPISGFGKYGTVYVIGLVIGSGAAGVYGAVRSLSDALPFLATAILLAVVPAQTRLFASGDLNRLRAHMRFGLHIFLLAALPVAVGASLYARPLLRLFTVPAIAVAGADVMPVTMCAALCLGVYSILGEAFALTRSTKWFLYVWGVIVPVQFGCSLLLVPAIGIVGGAVAEALAYASAAGVAAVFAWRRLGFSLDGGRLVRVVASAVLAAGVATLFPRDGPAWLGGAMIFGTSYIVGLLVTRAVQLEEVTAYGDMFGLSRLRPAREHTS